MNDKCEVAVVKGGILIFTTFKNMSMCHVSIKVLIFIVAIRFVDVVYGIFPSSRVIY